MKELPSPKEVKTRVEASVAEKEFVLTVRKEISAILTGTDPRKILIAGPCSIHNLDAALSFAEKFARLKTRVEEEFLLVMRTYFEKSRTSLGWPGFLYDPHLDGSGDVETGIVQSRAFLIKLSKMKIGAATEFVAKPSALYLSDLISWGSIGARTASSQLHRHMASLLQMPIGFKNSTDGTLDTAIAGIETAKVSHPLLWINEEGRASHVKTSGNPWGHLVLRGGDLGPNYSKKHIQEALLQTNYLLVDCAHGNSGKDPEKQTTVFKDVIDQIANGSCKIRGLMMEAFLKKGAQPPIYPLQSDLSITDPCLDFLTFEKLVLDGAKTIKNLRKSRIA